MNPRDKSVVVILLTAVVGISVVSFVGYRWFWAPLKAYNASIEQLQDENEQSQQEWNLFLKGRKKLEVAKLKSLPIKPDQASAEYVPYLEGALRYAGLAQLQLMPGNAVKVKPPASVPEVKEVEHRTIAFSVKATGDEAALVSFLDRLQHAPYEHRVKNLTVERFDKTYGPAASKKLNIDMVIEVLLVGGNKNTMGLHPGVDPQLYLYNHVAARFGAAPAGWGLWSAAVAAILTEPASDHREYASIARRNVFVGAIPIVRTTPKVGKTQQELADAKQAQLDAEAAVAPPEFVPGYVRLTTVVPTLQEAYLFNRIYGGREVKLIAKPGSGYDLFKITDEDRSFVFFMGKVLSVGGREMYFQVRDQVYVLHIGKSLAEAMRSPLQVDDLLDLDLYDLYDKSWAAEQMAEGQKKPDAGKKKRGGKGG